MYGHAHEAPTNVSMIDFTFMYDNEKEIMTNKTNKHTLDAIDCRVHLFHLSSTLRFRNIPEPQVKETDVPKYGQESGPPWGQYPP